MSHETKSVVEFDLEKYLQNSNDVNILIIAFYRGERKMGKYRCLLLYKQHMKLVEGSYENVVSPNHAMILGLIDTVKHINLHEVNVCIISGIYVGFKGAMRNKGLYAKEINELVGIVEKQGNTISSIAITDGMDMIKKIIKKKCG